MKELKNGLIFGFTRIDEARGIAWIDGYSNARTLKGYEVFGGMEYAAAHFYLSTRIEIHD